MEAGVDSLLTLLSSLHEYVMLVNGLACFYLMTRKPRILFNFYQLSSPADFWVFLSFLCLPVFYTLESLPTLSLCATFYLSACKYAIHHLLTTAVFCLMFQYDLLTGPSYLVQATHGLMNFCYYQNELWTYLFCRWYVAATAFCFGHMAYHLGAAGTPMKIRVVLGLALSLLLAISINNSQTDELTSLCELNPSDSSLERDIKVWTAHCLAASALAYSVYTQSKKGVLLPIALRDVGAKYY